ncbi:MAG: alkaline phosphatase family protein, partial [Acidobacteriota bacterium]
MLTEINDSPLIKAIREAYHSGQEDEALEPLVLVDKDGNPIGRISRGDSVIFYDLRGEREIQLTQALTEKNNDFHHFSIEDLDLNFVTMIEYHPSLRAKVAFPPQGAVKNTFGEVIASQGLELVKIAESEKAIHLGFFMNGKQEITFPGEKRIIVPSPQDVSSYAEVPQMNAAGVTKEIISRINSSKDGVVVINYANVDVVGHIEEREAVIKAVECVDEQLGKVIQAARDNKFTLVVTSDHGTVEEWNYPDGTINTGHTKNPVPFILADFFSSTGLNLKSEGELADVAPTLLDLLNIPAPPEMTGKSLLINQDRNFTRKKILLLILDGWGIRQEESGNLIAQARTPNFDFLWKKFPGALLKAAGEAVGMPSNT